MLDGDGQGVPYGTYAFAAQIAEAEVDVELGTVRVTRMVAAHDVGRAVNPQQVEGQVHGGIAQGLGLALMEEYLPGRTENLHDYLVPSIGDMPEVEVLIVEATRDSLSWRARLHVQKRQGRRGRTEREPIGGRASGKAGGRASRGRPPSWCWRSATSSCPAAMPGRGRRDRRSRGPTPLTGRSWPRS